MSERIVLKCDPKDLAERTAMVPDLEHDSVAAACYQQAIDQFASCAGFYTDRPAATKWIEQRAAELLAEKLR